MESEDESDEECNLSDKEFRQQCEVGKPENVTVEQKINDYGKLDLILQWKQPVDKSKLLGFKNVNHNFPCSFLNFIKSLHYHRLYIYRCNCCITIDIHIN